MREPLPPRRACETRAFVHDGLSWRATLGFYPDGRLGEVFLDAAKINTMIAFWGADLSIATSLALQYGCPPDVLARAMTSSTRGEPMTPMAALLRAYTGPAAGERAARDLAAALDVLHGVAP